MAVRNLGALAMVVAVLVAINAAISPVLLLWVAVDLESAQATIAPIFSELNYATIGFNILTMIVFSVWIYQAGQNLIAAGFDDLEFTPGARIWWFAVPIATLFKPFQGMRELWNASHGSTDYDDTKGIVAGWWALWLISTIGNTIVSRMSGPDGPGVELSWGLTVIDIALAVVAILLVRGITRAQAANLSSEGLGEVFA